MSHIASLNSVRSLPQMPQASGSPSVDEGESIYEMETTSTDPFVYWRLNQTSFQRLSDDDLLKEAEAFFGQGLYRQALEKLALHPDKEARLPEFVEKILGDYIPPNPQKELPFELQIDDLWERKEANEEKGASLFQIMLEAGELFAGKESAPDQRDQDLIACFNELKIDNTYVFALILKIAAQKAADQESFFEALWFLWGMNPFDETKNPEWFKCFSTNRDEASVHVVKGLAAKGAFSLALRLSYTLSSKSLQKEAVFSVARQLNRRGFLSLARSITREYL